MTSMHTISCPHATCESPGGQILASQYETSVRAVVAITQNTENRFFIQFFFCIQFQFTIQNVRLHTENFTDDDEKHVGLNFQLR